MTTEANGDCFPTAFRLLMVDPDYTLCHGIVTGAEGTPGEMPHWHAWVEKTQTFSHEDWPHDIEVTTAIDKSNGNDVEMSTALYYKIGQVSHVVRYTFDEAMILAATTEHYGPWEE